MAEDVQKLMKDSEFKTPYSQWSLHALFSYSDFKFKASNPVAINRFQGHNNLYLLGGNSAPISNSIIVGLFIYKLNTYLSFMQPSVAETSETIRNNSLYGHVLKQIQPSIFVDLMGGYGQNSLNYTTYSIENNETQYLGNAKSHGDNWFIGLKAFYNYRWNDFGLLSSIGPLYTQVNQNAFNIFLLSEPENPISARSSKATFLLENAELTYKHYETIQPFVTGGFIQVLQSRVNHLDAAALSLAVLPNQSINLDKNGFSVGAGLSWRYRRVLLRLEQQYYQRGSIYHSNQSIASMRFAID